MAVGCWPCSKPWVPLRSGCHPILGCGIPTMVLSPQPVSVQPGHIPLGHRVGHPHPPVGCPLPPPATVLQVRAPCPTCPGSLGSSMSSSLASGCGGGNGADRHPLHPTGALGQGPPQPMGSLPRGHLILVPITGRLRSSKHPGDAPMGVHSPALCLRARQPLRYFNLLFLLMTPSWAFYSLYKIPRESLAPGARRERARLPRQRGAAGHGQRDPRQKISLGSSAVCRGSCQQQEVTLKSGRPLFAQPLPALRNT